MARLGNWAARHGHALLSTLGHLGRHGTGTALTVLALALALAVPLSLSVLVANVGGVGADLSASLGVSVFLRPQLSETALHQTAAAARRLPGVRTVRIISASQGLALLRAQPGFAAAIDTLTDNPLPAVLEIQPTDAAATPDGLEQLRGALARLPEVDAVQLDREWAVRFQAIVSLARTLLRVAATLLALGVLAIIGNTVRLEIQARTTEIEVTKLVGGSNGFVRRPFLYAGVLYGAASGTLAWGLVSAGVAGLTGPVRQLASAYGSVLGLQGPGLRDFGVLVGVGALLGWLGAAVATGRELARIEPRAQ